MVDSSTGPIRYGVSMTMRENLKTNLAKLVDSEKDLKVNIEVRVLSEEGKASGDLSRILDEYAARDPRVRVIHKPNGGAGEARNVGLDAATGEYLFFCDPDDWCDRRMLVEMSARAERTDADLVFVSNYVCEGDNDAIVGRQRISAL